MKQKTNIKFIKLTFYNNEFGSTLVKHNISFLLWTIFDKIYRILERANIKKGESK